MDSKSCRNYCEIDLNAISHNIGQIRNIIDNRVKIMGIVKGDAYGHGAIRMAETLINEGVEYLAVATVEEALELRERYEKPILVFGYVSPNFLPDAINNNITLSIFNSTVGEQIVSCAKGLNKKVKVHIKLDTGMNRVGFLPSQLNEVLELKDNPNLDIEGIYTHFSCADTGLEFTEKQFSVFSKMCTELSAKGLRDVLKHCCNSAALIRFPQMHMDIVRPGIILYGLNPTESKIELKPAMSFKTKVIHLKNISEGSKISYGGTFTAKRESLIATLAVGYADGYPRALSNNMNILIRGEFAPVVGRICMDLCMIDVTDIKGIELFDTAVIFGVQGEKRISAEEIAEKLNTITYEVVSLIGKRVPRLYINEH